MNKQVLLVAAALLFFVPFSTHAAFSFSRTSHNDSGGGFSIGRSTSPLFSGTSDEFPANANHDLITSNSASSCNTLAGRLGLSDSDDAYCVYDSYYYCGPAYGSGDMGSGSGGSSTGGGDCNSSSHTITKMTMYQTSFQSRNLDQMIQALQDYYWAKAFGQPATDPGYRDVCEYAHNDDPDAGVSAFNASPHVCDIYHHDGVTVTKPVASLNASPSTLVSGNSSNLTYSCTNGATSASISNGVGTLSNPASGSKSVSPTVTTTYTLTCSNSAGSDTDTASVTVYPVLSASCSVNDTSIAKGGSATWSASASGGTGTYSYSWSGTDSLSGSGSSVTKTYSSTGTKTASVTVTSGSQTKTVSCGNSLTVSNPPLTATCSVSPTSITTGGSATWTAYPSGGTGSYTYTWAGSASGTSQSSTKTYSTAGTYSASVTVKDSSSASTGSVSCSNSVVVSNAPKPDLTAGNIPASTYEPGSVSLTSSIGNSGNASTGAGFSVLFQKATSASGASAADLGYVTTTALGSGSSRSVSKSFTFTAGTYYVRACADKSSAGDGGDIAESSESNNCGAWTQLTVAVAAQPDLTAGAVTPTSATAGSAVTLRSTVSNIGNASTGAGFSVLFQQSGSSSGSGAADIGYDTVSATGAGGSNTASKSYTFSSAGTYYVRACADKSSAGDGGDIAESSESNNCGAWTAITVGDVVEEPPPDNPKLSCRVSETTIAPGDSVTYTATAGSNRYQWSATRVGAQTVDGEITSTNTLTATYTSAGTAVRSVGASGFDSTNCPAVVVSDEPVCTDPEASIAANKDRVQPGDTVVLTYDASGIEGSCTVSGPGVSKSVTANACTVGSSTITTPGITTQSTYTISCSGGATDSVTINVVPKFEEF